jgi:hypothetical protein
MHGGRFWKKGISVYGSSDAPVEEANPLRSIHAAVNRQSPEGHSPGGWMNEEALTVYEAVSLFTRYAGAFSREPALSGTLEEGKYADFVVLSADPFSVHPDTIATIKILETWIAGCRVFPE